MRGRGRKGTALSDIKLDYDPYSDMLPCGPWLRFSAWKRLWLFLRYWPLCIVLGFWRSRYYWWRYLLHKLRLKPYLLEYDELDWEQYGKLHPPEVLAQRQAEAKRYWGIWPREWFVLYAGSAHPRWLWYESRTQTSRKPARIDYLLGWDGKWRSAHGAPVSRVGWYPFWGGSVPKRPARRP